MENSYKTTLFLLIVMTMLTSACSIHKEVANQAVSYNHALEQTQNEVLLLNVVRASLRQPMHFSTITQILGHTSNPTLTPSLTLGIPAFITKNVDDAKTTVGKTGPGVSTTLNRGSATATIAVLDSKEFIRGILNPIDVKQLDYFLQQGWPEEQLLTLFIREMVIEGTRYTNRPSEEFKKVNSFITKIREIVPDLTIEEKVVLGETVGVPFAVAGKDLASLILTADKDGLTLQKHDTTDTTAWYQFRKKTKEKQILLKGIRVKTGRALQDSTKEKENQFFFRSTQGIIYYLGQILRYQKEQSPMPFIETVRPNDAPRKDVLFFAQKKKYARSAIAVQHSGDWYSIPLDLELKTIVKNKEYHEHRSMSVLTLVSQLIGLNKSRSELPSTGVVTVVGN